MKKISVSLSGHQTSITLEPEFIDALHALAVRIGKPVAQIIGEIDDTRSDIERSDELDDAVFQTNTSTEILVRNLMALNRHILLLSALVSL